MGTIINLGCYWGYKPEVCDGCIYLEKSRPFGNDPTDIMVACDAPKGICVKTGVEIYGAYS